MAAENDEERQEISRLLYVATTRAADYLILSPASKILMIKASGPWMELLDRRFDRKSGRDERTGRRGEGKTGRWSE